MNVFNGDFTREDQTVHFTIQNVLLRGMRLQNTEFAAIALIYTGKNSRVLRNSQKQKVKRSRLEGRVNWLMALLIILALVFMLVFAILGVCKFDEYTTNPLYQLEPTSKGYTFTQRFVQFFVITA